jgi:hypothetical protein
METGMDEILFTNARILTCREDGARAEALLVRGETIAAVGSLKEVRGQASDTAELVDLGGQTLVPGFNDNHVHTIIFGDHETVPDLAGRNEQEVVEAVREHYRDAPAGHLLVAYGWDYTHCKHPHKSLLDEAFPNNPVVLPQFSGHGQWVNSFALKELGIDRTTPDPEVGRILRDENGEPTGILREMALNKHMAQWFRRIHNRREVARRRIRQSLDWYRSFGVTSVQDNTWYPKAVDAFRSLLRDDELTCRISCWSYGEDRWASWRLRHRRYAPPWVSPGPEKFFLDGTFSTQTAWLTEPYPGTEDYGQGKSAEEIARALGRVVRGRRQVASHAIGDRAVKEYVDAVERVAERYPWTRNLRIRIEHGQLIRPEDIPRIRDLGMVVSAQPSAMATPEKDAEILGAERARRAYPYRSLLDAGVPLSFGSDIPGERTMNPLLAMHYVVNREGAEAITPAEALRCYTAGSAHAEFEEERKGTLEAGKLADLAVLSGDPTAVDPARIKEIRATMTFVGGRRIYDEAAEPLR